MKHHYRSIKNGFTLAEVLITLGVIGVVAALTLPSLIEKHDKQVISTRLKKFYSTMNQAILLYEQKNNISKEYFDFSSFCDGLSKDSYECNLNVFNEYFAPYVKYTKIEKQDSKLVVYLADGSAYYTTYYGHDIYFLPKASKIVGKSSFSGLKLGKDMFFFAIYPGGASANRDEYFRNLGMEPYIIQEWDGTYQGLYSSCSNAAKILQLNNWEFPNDYPCLKQ